MAKAVKRNLDQIAGGRDTAEADYRAAMRSSHTGTFPAEGEVNWGASTQEIGRAWANWYINTHAQTDWKTNLGLTIPKLIDDPKRGWVVDPNTPGSP